MKPFIRAYDTYVGEKIGSLPARWYGFLDWLCIIISPIGWTVIIVGGIALALVLGEGALVNLSVLALLLLPLAEGIKLVFRRPRPLSLYAESMRLKSYSFPSGHAYGAGLGCGYVFLFTSAFLAGIWLWLLGIVLAATACTVAGARVYLKAHFPSDVTVGLMLGVFTISVIGWWAL